MALFSRDGKEGQEFYETTGVLRTPGQPARSRRRSFDQLDVPKGDVLDLRTEEAIEEKPAKHFVEKPRKGGQIFYSQAMPLPIAISDDDEGISPFNRLRQVRGIFSKDAAPAKVSTNDTVAPNVDVIFSTIGVAVAVLILLSIAVFAYAKGTAPMLPHIHRLGL